MFKNQILDFYQTSLKRVALPFLKGTFKFLSPEGSPFTEQAPLGPPRVSPPCHYSLISSKDQPAEANSMFLKRPINLSVLPIFLW